MHNSVRLKYSNPVSVSRSMPTAIVSMQAIAVIAVECTTAVIHHGDHLTIFIPLVMGYITRTRFIDVLQPAGCIPCVEGSGIVLHIVNTAHLVVGDAIVYATITVPVCPQHIFTVFGDQSLYILSFYKHYKSLIKKNENPATAPLPRINGCICMRKSGYWNNSSSKISCEYC